MQWAFLLTGEISTRGFVRYPGRMPIQEFGTYLSFSMEEFRHHETMAHPVRVRESWFLHIAIQRINLGLTLTGQQCVHLVSCDI